METLVDLFFEKEVDDLQFKLLAESDKNDESNIITLIQKFIFKQDVVANFKQLLQCICWSEEFTVQNEMVEKTIQRLVSLLLSNANDEEKVKVFHYFFRAFSLSSKESEENVIQFFILLVFLVGLNYSSGKDSKKPMGALKKEAFEKNLNVKIEESSPTSYKIINKLLLDFSQLSININSPDNLKYHSWFSELIKNIATSQPFDSIFLEIFSTSCDIDIKIFEVNLQSILLAIFFQQKCNDSNFNNAYKSFLLKTFKICAKFQRSQKFISRFFFCLKSVNTSLAKEVILPEEFLIEFSNVIKMMSSQQSLSIFETLLLHLNEIFSTISNDTLDVGEAFLSSIVEVSKRFFEEVKIFSPSLSAASAKLFVEKLKLFKNILQKYAAFLSENTEFALNNDLMFLSFLDLCYYCTELEVLINCYKDFFLEDINSSDEKQTLCIDTELWNNIIKVILKFKLIKFYSVCIALQRLRILKLNQRSITMEESTQKIIVLSFLSDEVGTTILNFVSPEDITLIMEVSTKKQQKKIVTRILKDIFLNVDTKLAWLSDSRLEENIVFVIEMFSNLMSETYKNLDCCLDHKTMTRFKWLSQEYFNENNIVNAEVIETLPETINALFKKLKVKKTETETLDKEESLLKIVEIFRRLPLVHLNPECSRLGLSFAIGIATVCLTHKKTMPLLLECILNFLNSDLDPSICFNIGLSIKWLSDLFFEDKNTNELRIKLIQTLVRSCRNSKFGLTQIGEMIKAPENCHEEKQLRSLETQVTIYFELGKCLVKAKKRKPDNELIGSYRSKLAKVISEKANDMSIDGLKSDNYKVLFKIGADNLNRALKLNNKDEITDFIQKKFESYFECAINNLKTEYDESSVLILSSILHGIPAMKKDIPGDTLYRIWVVFKEYEKIPWRFFTINSTEKEFDSILNDLLHITKRFLDSEKELSSTNCFEIWATFFEASEDVKTNRCQIALQKLFDYIIDCDFLIADYQIKKQYFLIKFLSFCLTNKKVILTSQMMDTVVHLILQPLNGNDLEIKDFHELFVVRVEACSAILSGQFTWNKNKVHLIYDLFQHLLFSFTSKCNSNLNINNDDIFLLSVCALSLEKWAGLMIGKQKHFARIGAYFIASIISCVASVTLFPAVKIHLVNCLNHFLSISDSHTYSYLLRILKPGYQQVFSSMYEQFKKYHKFTGKV